MRFEDYVRFGTTTVCAKNINKFVYSEISECLNVLQEVLAGGFNLSGRMKQVTPIDRWPLRQV